MDTVALLRTLQGVGDMRVSTAEVFLDRAQYRAVSAQVGVRVDTGLAGIPTEGSAAILTRWQEAAGVRLARAHTQLAAVHADGSPAPLPSLGFGALARDEVVDLPAPQLARYRVVAPTRRGTCLPWSIVPRFTATGPGCMQPGAWMVIP